MYQGVERGANGYHLVFVVLSSMPPTVGVRDGWLILDRVIDAPVYQDILT